MDVLSVSLAAGSVRRWNSPGEAESDRNERQNRKDLGFDRHGIHGTVPYSIGWSTRSFRIANWLNRFHGTGSELSHTGQKF